MSDPKNITERYIINRSKNIQRKKIKIINLHIQNNRKF